MNNEHISYLVGFLQGDGSNYEQSRNRGKISTELSIRDSDILDQIEKLFNDIYSSRRKRTRDTNFKKDYSSDCLTIYNIKTRRFLSKFIPAGKKCKTIKPPEAEDFFEKRHYIRGLTDADGSIGITSNNRPFWSLCTSSESVKSFFLKDIIETLNFDKRLNRNKRDNVYNIILYDEDAIEYLKRIYNNASIFSKRKHKLFKEVILWKRTSQKRKGRKKIWLPYEDKIAMNNSLLIEEKMKLLNRSKSSVVTRIWRNKRG